VLLTFHFVAIGWVFFRAPTIAKAVSMFGAVLHGDWSGSGSVIASYAFVVALMLIFLAVHAFDDHRRIRIAVRTLRPEILWPVLVGLWLVAIAVSQGNSAKFIYFDF
jgi:hypothetical protein